MPGIGGLSTGELGGVGGGTSGGGGGAVNSVTATDASIVVSGTVSNPTIATGTLDQIANLHTAVANWTNGGFKITNLANGTAATDAAAFGQIPTVALNRFSTLTITADPAPATPGIYYRCNYAANGNFTLGTPSTVGMWVMVKQIANNTLSIVGTLDGNASLTLVQFQSYTFIWNGTNWDIT